MSNKVTTDALSEIQKVFMSGTLVELNIGKQNWKTKLLPEDLGLTEVEDNFKLGTKKFLEGKAIEYIALIEGRARVYLHSKSFVFNQNTGSSFPFVPTKLFEEVEVALQSFKNDFYAGVKELVKNYDQLQEEMAKAYSEQWSKLKVHLPPVDTLEKKHYFVFTPFEISFPKRLMKTDAATTIKRAQMDEEHEKLLLAARNDYKVQMAAKAESLIGQAVTAVRGRIMEVFKEQIENRAAGKKFTKASENAIRGVIANVRDIDFLDDADFQEKLTKIEENMDKVNDFKDNESAVKELDKMLLGTIEFAEKTTESRVVAMKKQYFSRKLTL